MGEYAKRKSDDQEIKIGTCEDMYYIRYEDRSKVSKLPNSLDCSQELNLRWRLPFADEDSVRPGEYKEHNRFERLYAKDDTDCRNIHLGDDEDSVGVMQLYHQEAGLLINVPCHHGQKLPDIKGHPKVKAFWNGKGYALVLSAIKNTEDGIKPIVRCRFCGQAWRFDWADVFPYVNGEMRTRLRPYAEAEESQAQAA